MWHALERTNWKGPGEQVVYEYTSAFKGSYLRPWQTIRWVRSCPPQRVLSNTISTVDINRIRHS